MKTFLVTHTDLDGIGAAILAKKAIPNLVSVAYEDYPTIDNYLTKFCSRDDFEQNDLLLIADISPSAEVCQILNEKANNPLIIKLFDHHETKEKCLEQYSWATYSDKKAGTTLVYDELLQTDPQLSAYNDFAQAVEAWDMWQLDSPFRTRGERLHNLHKFIGTKEFVDAFVESPNADMEEPLKSVIRFTDSKKNRVVKAIVHAALDNPILRIDSLGRTFMIVVATDYVSEVAHAILGHPDYSDLGYIVVYNPLFEVCSLRSRGVDVGDVARRLNGGGRKTTAGFPYYMKRNLEENIFKIINAIDYA